MCTALVLPLLAPAAVSAQGVTIEHEEVGCIVAGKFPKMNACFTPASQVKKRRVYFRPETLTAWYYVEMISDAPCFTGILLRPNKSLVDKKLFYYIEAGDSRSPEYGPTVVADAESCKSRRPVAPLSATGPAAVFPSSSVAGFLGPASASFGVAAAGFAAAAAVGGGALLLTGDDSPAPNNPPTVPTTNPPATSPTTTLPPPVVAPGTPLVVTCQAAPRNGEAPLRVAFATFPNGGTGSYEFFWSFGDGATNTNPNPSHTFVTAGVFDATVVVRSGDQVAACSRAITVTLPPTPPTAPPTFTLNVGLSGSGTGTVTGPNIKCPGDCTEAYATGTPVTLVATPQPGSVFKQWTGACTGSGPCVLTMTANKNVVAQFELLRTLTVTVTSSFGGSGTVTSDDGQISCSVDFTNTTCTDTGSYVNGVPVTLTATPNFFSIFTWGGDCPNVPSPCILTMNADKNVTTVFNGSAGLTAPPGVESAARPVAWSTQLEVPDGEGQVMMNGRAASSVRSGLAAMAAESRTGANRVEAVLVRGSGRPGMWRFDFSGQAALKPGTLRVVAGTVSLITGDAVVFRLQGKPGERIVFTFELE